MKPAFLRNFQPGASKYGNKKVVVDGIEFDSKKEAKVYSELLLCQRAGEITDIQRQVSYELVPAQYLDGKCIERAVTYKADFVVTHADGEVTVIDAKGFKDAKYPIKRKLMLHVHKVRIKEV